jgi:DNA-binding transcriptional MerR regulator
VTAQSSRSAGPNDGSIAAGPVRLLRIQEVASETGLTARSIRYYEELGLLRPAARSEGAYRLFDDDDLERLRFIRGLRDDAGFSLAEISQLLEDEDARAKTRARFRQTADAGERAALLLDAITRIDRQCATLEGKIGRLREMVADRIARRERLLARLAELEAEAPSGRRADASPDGRASVTARKQTGGSR